MIRLRREIKCIFGFVFGGPWLWQPWDIAAAGHGGLRYGQRPVTVVSHLRRGRRSAAAGSRRVTERPDRGCDVERWWRWDWIGLVTVTPGRRHALRCYCSQPTAKTRTLMTSAETESVDVVLPLSLTARTPEPYTRQTQHLAHQSTN